MTECEVSAIEAVFTGDAGRPWGQRWGVIIGSGHTIDEAGLIIQIRAGGDLDAPLVASTFDDGTEGLVTISTTGTSLSGSSGTLVWTTDAVVDAEPETEMWIQAIVPIDGVVSDIIPRRRWFVRAAVAEVAA